VKCCEGEEGDDGDRKFSQYFEAVCFDHNGICPANDAAAI